MADRHVTANTRLRAILAIGWADFVLKYRGSVLGYAWSLIGPFVKFLVILYVFGPYVRASVPFYPLYLFLGIIIWEHFSITTSHCISMLFEKQSMIQRHKFPHILLILATGWTNIIIFMTHVVIFIMVGLWMGVPVTANVAYMAIIMLQMTLVALGVGMALSAYCLEYRDIGHLWAIATQILFWLTPIMYPYKVNVPVTASIMNFIRDPSLHNVHGVLNIIVHFQPVAMIIHDARRVTLYTSAAGVPSLEHVIGVTAVCILLFLGGKWLFDRRSPYFVEQY